MTTKLQLYQLCDAPAATPVDRAHMQQLLRSQQLGLFQCALLSDGARLEISTSPTGRQSLNVFSDGKLVASFSRPGDAMITAHAASASAANDPKMPAAVGLLDQWWDDDLLNEPLEPLPEFELPHTGW